MPLNVRSDMHLLDRLFTTDSMRECFSDQRRLQRMLDFESALARALVRNRIAPGEIASPIEACCRAELFSIDALARETALAGNVAIPMVKALTALVAQKDEKAAQFVHWGATSQDVIDTGLILQIREALELLDQETAQLRDSLAALAEKHAATLMAGRTWLQQAGPTTLGLKAAGWLDAIARHRARLREMRTRVLVLQFGGAVGTLAALGDQGMAVAAHVAEDLNLGLPAVPWHTHRDRLAEVAVNLGLLTGTMGKIARDISLMAQSEVGEISEPAAPGRGGSSTLPQKRNPVSSAIALAAAERLPALVSTMLASMTQEYERGLGGWQAEWETLPEIFLLAGGALAHLNLVAKGLEVNGARLAANLNLTGGLIMAEAVAFVLARHVGKSHAHEIVEQACRRSIESGRPLAEILNEDKKVRTYLSAEQIARAMDPAKYLGSTREMIQSVLSMHKKDKS